jgi:hypothetical protein
LPAAAREAANRSSTFFSSRLIEWHALALPSQQGRGYGGAFTGKFIANGSDSLSLLDAQFVVSEVIAVVLKVWLIVVEQTHAMVDIAVVEKHESLESKHNQLSVPLSESSNKKNVSSSVEAVTSAANIWHLMQSSSDISLTSIRPENAVLPSDSQQLIYAVSSAAHTV